MGDGDREKVIACWDPHFSTEVVGFGAASLLTTAVYLTFAVTNLFRDDVLLFALRGCDVGVKRTGHQGRHREITVFRKGHQQGTASMVEKLRDSKAHKVATWRFMF